MKKTEWLKKLPEDLVREGVKAGVIPPTLPRAIQIQQRVEAVQREKNVDKSEAVQITSFEFNLSTVTIWKELRK